MNITDEISEIMTEYIWRSITEPLSKNNNIKYDLIIKYRSDIIENNKLPDLSNIEDNILCEKCKNPETDIAKDKKKDYIVCKACSHKTLQ